MTRIDRATREELTERLDEVKAETREIRQQLRQAEQDEFIVVQFHGNSQRYTYEADNPCEVGDYCVVHSPRTAREELVRVVALGRGTWPYATKVAKRVGSASWIYARLVEEVLTKRAPTTVYGFTPDQLMSAIDFATERGWTAHVEQLPLADVPDGTYRVVCANVEHRESKATGRPYLLATHVILDHPFAGILIYQPLMDHGPACWIWNEAAERAADVEGKILFAEVKREVYENTPRTRVGKLTLHSSGGA